MFNLNSNLNKCYAVLHLLFGIACDILHDMMSILQNDFFILGFADIVSREYLHLISIAGDRHKFVLRLITLSTSNLAGKKIVNEIFLLNFFS